LICPNCGRRNPAGATFCSRCKQRLPLATRYSGQGYKRAVIAEPSGGGSGGVLVLGVALLAAFIFIGGGAAIYLSTPQQTQTPTNLVANGSQGPSLPPFTRRRRPRRRQASVIPTPFFFSPIRARSHPLPTDSCHRPRRRTSPPRRHLRFRAPLRRRPLGPAGLDTDAQADANAVPHRHASSQGEVHRRTESGNYKVDFTNKSTNATTYSWTLADSTRSRRSGTRNTITTRRHVCRDADGNGTGRTDTSAPKNVTVNEPPPPLPRSSSTATTV